VCVIYKLLDLGSQRPIWSVAPQKKKQSRQCTYNVTLMPIRVALDVEESQYVLLILSVCL